jgi:hypothetical protein
MKRLIVAATVAVGLAAASSASAAQYETYTAELGFNHQLKALVGHTSAEYAQAQRAANSLETRRRLGLGPQSIVTMAIDASAGVAQQVRWIRPDNTVAVVDIH